MDKLPIVEMAEINDYIVATENFQNVITISEIDAAVVNVENLEKDGYSTPVRLNALFIVLVRQGTINVSIDYAPYSLSANSFMLIMPTHIFQVADQSKDFKVSMLVVDKSFLEECNTAKRSPSMTAYMELKRNPCTTFLPEETKLVYDALSLLKQKIKLRTHSFHKEVVQNAFVGFLLDLANILIGKNDLLARPTLTRKEELLNQFLQLLFTHVKEYHAVTFYAGKLFITPQYLSLVLKELTGKSANKWIDDALMVEARVLLKMPQTTIQQVADQLNFSDQSTFGKFFKKHMKMSPLEYRKSQGSPASFNRLRNL